MLSLKCSGRDSARTGSATVALTEQATRPLPKWPRSSTAVLLGQDRIHIITTLNIIVKNEISRIFKKVDVFLWHVYNKTFFQSDLDPVCDVRSPDNGGWRREIRFIKNPSSSAGRFNATSALEKGQSWLRRSTGGKNVRWLGRICISLD